MKWSMLRFRWLSGQSPGAYILMVLSLIPAETLIISSFDFHCSPLSQLTLSRPGAAHCAPFTKIPAYLQNSWEFGVSALWLFFLCIFHLQKFSSTSQPSCTYMLPWQPCNFFGLFLKTRISTVFQVFPPERNFLWDNLLYFGHPNTLKSLIKANIRFFTMETFQKIILPKYGHQH